MRSSFRAVARRLAVGIAVVTIMPTASYAQEAADDATEDDKEIIVTGTLIRG